MSKNWQVDTRYQEAESYLKKISEKLRKKDINTQRVVVYGPAVDKIIHVAEKENADLIAMTSHGGGGLTRVFYGSVAEASLTGWTVPSWSFGPERNNKRCPEQSGSVILSHFTVLGRSTSCSFPINRQNLAKSDVRLEQSLESQL
jgi:hypothetical protein